MMKSFPFCSATPPKLIGGMTGPEKGIVWFKPKFSFGMNIVGEVGALSSTVALVVRANGSDRPCRLERRGLGELARDDKCKSVIELSIKSANRIG